MSELGGKQGGIGCSTCLLGSSFARGFLGEVLGSSLGLAAAPQSHRQDSCFPGILSATSHFPRSSVF